MIVTLLEVAGNLLGNTGSKAKPWKYTYGIRTVSTYGTQPSTGSQGFIEWGPGAGCSATSSCWGDGGARQGLQLDSLEQFLASRPKTGASRDANRSTCASPKRCQFSWTVWGWSLHSPGSAAHDTSSAVRLSMPGIWMARSDLRCFWLQRRRWRASCDMRREHRPPCWLMYATVAVLSIRTSTCSPRKRLLRRFKARCTASNSRQLICQCSWGPVQTPDTASPLNVAPQPLAEASV